MRRDAALAGWSREHHTALSLAQRILRAEAHPDQIARIIGELARQFAEDLAPHFQDEEAHLLPRLLAAGESALVTRTLQEHADLRALVHVATRPDVAAAVAFARLLKAHVRFEEDVLFPATERALTADALAHLAQSLAAHP